MELINCGNGVRVLLKESRDNDIVAFKVVLKMGGRYEPTDRHGVSNLALQSIIKGTKNATLEDLAGRLDNLGAQLETGSDKDGASLSLLCLRDSLMPGLEILWDVLFNPTFPKAHVKSEKKRIAMEIRQDEDSPMTYTYRSMQKMLYGTHPYGWPNKGTLETLKRLERNDAMDFYFGHLSQADIILCAVGNLDKDDLLKWVEERFGELHRPDVLIPEPDDEAFLPIVSSSPFVHEQEREVEAEVLVMGYLAPAILSPDFISMQLLNSVLGGSMDSRLFIEVREKRGLAYSVGSSFSSRVGPAMLSVQLATDPGNHDLALSQCLTEMDRLKNEKIGDDELRRAKEYMKGTFIMAQESNMGQADLYASSEYVGLGCEFVHTYADKVDSVTAEDIQETAQKYLDHYALAITRPKMGENIPR